MNINIPQNVLPVGTSILYTTSTAIALRQSQTAGTMCAQSVTGLLSVTGIQARLATFLARIQQTASAPPTRLLARWLPGA